MLLTLFNENALGEGFRSARDQLEIEEALKGNKRPHPSNSWLNFEGL